jgi:hypothetical protein
MARGVDYFENLVARLDELAVPQQFVNLWPVDKGQDPGAIAFFECPDAPGVVEMVVGKNYLLHRHFAYTGGEALDLVQDEAVGSGINDGIHILHMVPVPKDQVRVAAVNRVGSP